MERERSVSGGGRGVTVADLTTTFHAFVEEANQLRKKYSGNGMEILVGVETEHIYAEDLDLLKAEIDEHIKAGRIDFVVGSVHHADEHPIDFSKERFEEALTAYEAQINATRNGQNQPDSTDDRHAALSLLLESYFISQRRLMESLRPRVIGHFALPLLFTPTTRVASHPDAYALAVENIEYAISYGALFELSSAPFRKGLEYGWPGDEIVQIVREKGGIWCLSDDAHNSGQVGLNYSRLKQWAQRLGIEAHHIRCLGVGMNGAIEALRCDDIWEHEFWGNKV